MEAFFFPAQPGLPSPALRGTLDTSSASLQQQQQARSFGNTQTVSSSSLPSSNVEPSLVSGWALSAGALVVGAMSAYRHAQTRKTRQTRAARRGSHLRMAAVATRATPSGTQGHAGDVGAVLLSAGVGKRMGAGFPKQYIKLMGKEIALHSLEALLDCDIRELVIVCAEEYRGLFKEYLEKRGNVAPTIKFANGGSERQDSVFNGLAQLTTEFAAIHDCARPLVTKEEINNVIADARRYGAALLGVQTKATIKQATEEELDGDRATVVKTTPDRSTMWEAHTPQVVRCDLLRKGFEKAQLENAVVTDDVSLIEVLGQPVKLTQGEYTNIKVTTPEDIAVAESILKSRGL
mmetsp:Transcript_93459/g.204594  ORF Transcript_93459/g.204594 Transcript_93459/m.204594 type:complete len:349 (+) Transcript_93459:90-1136(+)